MSNDGSLSKVADGTLTTTTDTQSYKVPGSDRIMTVQATWDVTTPTADTAVPGTAAVTKALFSSALLSNDGNFMTVTDWAGDTWALAISKERKERQTFTFLTKTLSNDRDFMIFYDASGTSWAIGVNKTGTSAQPTATAWSNVPSARRAFVDISGGSTAASVAALFETAMNAMVGFTAAFTTDDSAANGTMIVDQDDAGAVAEFESYKGDAGTGTVTAGPGTAITGERTTAGYVSAEPSEAEWEAIDADHKDSLDVNALSTAASVAAAAELAFNALTGFTDRFTTDDTGADGSISFTATQADAIGDSTFVGDSISWVELESNPGAGGINTVNDTFFMEAHGMYTGLKGALSVSGGGGDALPGGLSAGTYYVIRVDANHVKWADSLAHAQAGTEIDLTDVGQGTFTFTPTALSASIKLQRSVDGSSWSDMLDAEMLTGTNSQTITADGTYVWIVPRAYWPYVRQRLTLAAGQLTLASAAYSK